MRSGDNPADPASREVLPVELSSQPLHIYGPDFLQLPEQQWTVRAIAEMKLPSVDQLPELSPNTSR